MTPTEALADALRRVIGAKQGGNRAARLAPAIIEALHEARFTIIGDMTPGMLRAGHQRMIAALPVIANDVEAAAHVLDGALDHVAAENTAELNRLYAESAERAFQAHRSQLRRVGRGAAQ